MVDHDRREMGHSSHNDTTSFNRERENDFIGDVLHEATANLTSCHKSELVEPQKTAHCVDNESFNTETLEDIDVNEGDFPACLHVDSGSLPCVSCGILGYPFMAIVQPSKRAIQVLFPTHSQEFHQKSGKSGCMNLFPSLPRKAKKLNSADMEDITMFEVQENQDSTRLLYPTLNNHLPPPKGPSTSRSFTLIDNNIKECSSHNAGMHDVISGKMSRSMSGHQIDSISNSMLEFDGNMSNISMPVNYVNDGYEHTVRRAKHQLKECAGDVHIKDVAIAENDTSSINLFGTGSRYETDSLLGEPVEKDGSLINRKWNKSNGFVRPRVFCLQHALEIVELLKSKGGTNVLITCHSDFVIIKAHAVVVAEEIGVKFKYKEVQLENASSEDLDLINFSIDDDEHQDWTSKLGLNLKYCVNLKKQLSTDKERLAFSLGRIFSDTSPGSVGSNLQWRSRKSRTPYQVIGTIQLKMPYDENMEKDKPQNRNSSRKEIQVYKSRRSGFNNMARKQYVCPQNSISKEISTGKELKIADDCDIHRKSNPTHFLKEEIMNDSSENLLTVPIHNTENKLMHQVGCTVETIQMPFDVSFAESEDLIVPADSSMELCKTQIDILPNEFPTVSDPTNSECHQSYTKHSPVGSAELHYGPQSPEELNTHNEELESVVDLVLPEFENTKLQKEIRVLDKTSLVPELNKAEYSSCVSPCKRTVGCTEDLPEDAVAQMPNLEGNFDGSVFSDQSTTPVLLSCNSEFQVVVSTVDEIKMENKSAVDNFESQKLVSTKDNTLRLENQFTDNAAINRSAKPQELSGTSEMEHNDKSSDSAKTWCSLEVSSNPPVDISGNPSHAIPKCSGMQEVVEANSNKPEHYCGAKDDGRGTRIVYKSYVRRNKRKKEAELITDSHHVTDSFVRGPCEGLRPRTRRMPSEMVETITVDKVAVKAKRVNGTVKRVGRRGKDKAQGSYKCNLEGCSMLFKTLGELKLHKRNRCTHTGCWKKFSLHQYLTRHQRVHDDKRPLKCPWKGCKMSFKWEWARTEHIRLHTGERPYKCNHEGCELTFRYVSDFSRHRRKTGHSVNSPD